MKSAPCTYGYKSICGDKELLLGDSSFALEPVLHYLLLHPYTSINNALLKHNDRHDAHPEMIQDLQAITRQNLLL